MIRGKILVYKTTIPKDHQTTREFLMKTFLMHESDLRKGALRAKEISLHCKYNLNGDKHQFWDDDIDVYFVGGTITDGIKKWLNDYKFTPVDSLPENLKHILGSYDGAVKGLVDFIP